MPDISKWGKKEYTIAGIALVVLLIALSLFFKGGSNTVSGQNNSVSNSNSIQSTVDQSSTGGDRIGISSIGSIGGDFKLDNHKGK